MKTRYSLFFSWMVIFFLFSCDRVMDPGESITISTGGSGLISVSPITGLVTSENHDTAEFQVVLKSQPASDVMIPVRSEMYKEGAISTASGYKEQAMLTFTAANWNQAQTVTIVGVDEEDWSGDPVQDGDILYVVSLNESISLDDNYNGINPSDVLITNYDNDFPGIIFLDEPDFFYTVESGNSYCYIRFKLRMQPSSNITIGPITTSDDSEGTIYNPYPPDETLTISSYDWNMEYSVVIQGQLDDGDSTAQDYTVDFGYISSSDLMWDGLAVGSFELTNYEEYPITNYVYFESSTTFESISGYSGCQNVVFEKNENYGYSYTAEQNGSALLDIGFDFTYLGMTFSSIFATTDGMATFYNGLASYGYYYDNYALTSSYGIRMVLAPWWDNLTVEPGNVYCATVGTAPNRIFVIEWNQVMNEDNDTETFTFQLGLYETTNVISFVYGDKSGGPDTGYVSSASIGINDYYDGYVDAGSGTYMTYDQFPASGTVKTLTPP